MKLRLVSVIDREADSKEFTFTPEETLHWTAGQYMHYVLHHNNPDDRGEERWFTNSAAPSEAQVRITTRINHEHSSSFKQALLALQPGDKIEADGPEGDFVLGSSDANYVFIVGGIGITPVRSILTQAAAEGLQIYATVLYANRTNDAVFKDQLADLQKQNPNLSVRYVIEPQKLDDDLLRTTIQATNDPQIYVSGPEPMVKSMLEQLKNLGVSEDHLHSDDFPGYEEI